MGTSPLRGAERAEQYAMGRDSEALGPSDSSDSGSDMTGLDVDRDDPNLPVDVATDTPGAVTPPLGRSDAAGTGARRSVAADAGVEGADVGPDRIEGGPSGGNASPDEGRVAPAPNEPREAEDLRDAPDDGLEPEPEDDIPRDSKS